jgi:hypothetical protein
MNQIYTILPFFPNSILILSSNVYVGLPSGISSLRFPTKMFYVFVIYPMPRVLRRVFGPKRDDVGAGLAQAV